MTQEEKAKAYDEALERAKKFEEKYGGGYAGHIFPELAESEDERIRKEIVSIIQKHYPNTPKSYRWISWLEKQKELPFAKDVILGYPGVYFYDGERMHFRGSPAMEEKQKKPHYTKRNALFDKCVENCDPEVMKEVSDNVDKMLEPKIAFGDWGDKEKKESIFNCLKYMRFIKKITNQEYDDLAKWLDNNLIYNLYKGWYLKKREQKEETLRDFIDNFPYSDEQEEQKQVPISCSHENGTTTEVCYDPKGDPDPAGVWKPSKEQMDALLHAMSFVSPATKESVLLSEIYENLKKS